MVHSLLEEHLLDSCPGCREEHNAAFSSRFELHAHYVVGDCANCGYRVELRRDEYGMGLHLPDGGEAVLSEQFRLARRPPG